MENVLFFLILFWYFKLTNVKGRVVGVAGASVSGFQDETSNARILDDVAPARISDIVGGAQ